MTQWIVVLHVMAGAAWFGGQVYVEGLMASAARTEDAGATFAIARAVGKTSVRVFSVSGLVLLISGVLIVLDSSTQYRFEDLFVSIGFLVVLIGLGVALFYFKPKGGELRAVVHEQGPASSDAAALLKQVSMVSHIMTLLVAIALVVMVLKTVV